MTDEEVFRMMVETAMVSALRRIVSRTEVLTVNTNILQLLKDIRTDALSAMEAKQECESNMDWYREHYQSYQKEDDHD